MEPPFELSVTSRYTNYYTREGIKYVGIPSDSGYSVHIKNNSNNTSDADVFVNERAIGSWPISSRDSLTVERLGGIGCSWSHEVRVIFNQNVELALVLVSQDGFQN